MFRGNLSDVLGKLGFSYSLNGTWYIYQAVVVWQDMWEQSRGRVKPLMCKDIYPAVAAQYGTTCARVERCIRHAIERAYDKAGYLPWREVFNNAIGVDGAITNGLTIAGLAKYCADEN